MIRQYSPQRFRYQTIRVGNRERLVCVGTVPVGTIFRCAPEHSRRERSPIVEAWHPREIKAWRKTEEGWQSTFVANGGHLATVRDLGNGSRFQLADHFIRFCVEHWT